MTRWLSSSLFRKWPHCTWLGRNCARCANVSNRRPTWSNLRFLGKEMWLILCSSWFEERSSWPRKSMSLSWDLKRKAPRICSRTQDRSTWSQSTKSCSTLLALWARARSAELTRPYSTVGFTIRCRQLSRQPAVRSTRWTKRHFWKSFRLKARSGGIWSIKRALTFYSTTRASAKWTKTPSGSFTPWRRQCLPL